MLVLLGAGAAGRAEVNSDIAAIWNDPTFQKQFVGYYGMNAELEPRVTPEEVKVLEKVRPMMANDLPGAETTLAKAIKPDSSAILEYTLASIQFQEDKMADALANYRKAVDKFPSFRRAWRNLGLIHTRNGSYDDAIAAFTRMIVLGGGDAYAYGLLGYSYAAKQDFQAAEAAYRNALLLQPENTEWRLGLTRAVFRQEKYEDAAALLTNLIDKYPDKADFWSLQASTFIGMKQPLQAAENLEALHLMGKATLDNLYLLGDIYVNESLLDLAEGAYRHALELDPAQAPGRAVAKAEVLAARGGTEQAQRLATQVDESWKARMSNDDRRRLLKLEARLSMARDGGDADTAKILEEIISLDPLDGQGLIMLGTYNTRQNQPDKAIFYFERAESLDAYEAEAKMNHAQVLLGMQRYAEALTLLRRVQEIHPRDDIARYIEQVERMTRGR